VTTTQDGGKVVSLTHRPKESKVHWRNWRERGPAWKCESILDSWIH